MADTKTEAKETKRAAYDFETWGWKPKGKAQKVKVNPLSCALAIPEESAETEGEKIIQPYWLRDKTHVPGTKCAREGDRLAERVLKFMWARQDVDEWWAHNAHAFDTLFLMAAADRLGWNVGGTVGSVGPILVEIWPPGTQRRRLKLRDLYRVIDSKLSKIAKDFHLTSQKLFDETDYQGDMRKLPLARLEAGNIADCLVLLEALDLVQELLGKFGGHLKGTFAASALSVASHELKENGVRLPRMRHAKTCSKKDCRCYWAANIQALAALKGARVEVVHHARADTQLRGDVRSMYPWAQSQLLPTRWKGNVEGKKARDAFAAGTFGIYKALVRVPKGFFPPLPFKPDTGGNYFPTGEWTAWFTGAELAYAHEKCRVDVKVYKGILYESGKPFADYLGKLFELKRKETGAFREFVKKLTVSSYGKYGEKPEREKLVYVPNLLEAAQLEANSRTLRPINPDVDPRIFAEKRIRYSPHVHYALAAYITAYARNKIHELASDAVGLSYLDTDSVDCVSWPHGFGDNLGDLHLEFEGFLGRYFAPKLYALLHPKTGEYLEKVDEKTGKPTGQLWVACKGFHKGKGKDFDKIIESASIRQALLAEGLSQALAKEGAKPHGQQLVRTRLFKSQLAPGATHHEVLRLKAYKTWSGLSKKRKPFPDGSTRPWTVEELQARKHFSALCPLL